MVKFENYNISCELLKMDIFNLQLIIKIENVLIILSIKPCIDSRLFKI